MQSDKQDLPVVSDKGCEVVEELVFVDGVALLGGVGRVFGDDDPVVLHLALERHAQREVAHKVGRLTHQKQAWNKNKKTFLVLRTFSIKLQ